MPLPILALVWPTMSLTHAATTTTSASVRQGGLAGALRITTEDTSIDQYVATLTHKGVPLMLGSAVPVELFGPDSLYSPIYGGYVNEADSLSIGIANAHASNDYDASASFEILRGARRRLVEQHAKAGTFNRSGFLVAGPTVAAQAIGAGSSYAFTISTASPYRMGRLIVPRKAGLAVTGITINGQPIVSDPTTGEFPQSLFDRANPANPRLSDVYPDEVTSRDTVVVTIKNYSAASLNVAPAIVCE